MADDSAPARRVADRYRLDRLIGRGGSGAVWRGFDERLRRPVAIKEITFSADADEADVGRRRALREARAAARLGGAGVVGVYDIIEADGRAYLIMELVDAPNLNTLIRRAGPMTPEAVAELGLRVLDILETAHRAGIVHRDVKPSNVLIDGDDPRLTDFGIARLGDDITLTSSGVVMGTPAYIAPEHARGDEIGPAVDLYGLGATMYFAVEGVPPFGSGGSLATVMAVLRDPPRPAERAGSLADVLDDLLAKDPAARPDAGSLRARLQAIAGTGDARRAGGRGGPAAPAAVVAEVEDGDRPDHEQDVAPPVDSVDGASEHAGGVAADTSTDEVMPGGSPPAVAAPADHVASGFTADDQSSAAALGDHAGAPGAAPDDERQVAPSRGAEVASASGSAGTRRRGVVAGVVVAVLLLSAFALSRAGDDPDVAGGGATAAGDATATATAEPPDAAGAPATTPSPDAGDADAGTPGRSPAPSDPPAPSPSPTPANDGVLPAHDVEVPDDWEVHDPDDLPYRVAHPPGWEVVRQSATLTDVTDPRTSTYLRLDWVADRRDPVAAWERQEESFAARHAGYERIQLRPTTYRGDRAALWEYRYREGGATLHAYNLGVNSGDNGFALNLQARESEFDAARELWPYFLASHRFEP